MKPLHKFVAMQITNPLFLFNGYHDKRTACKMVVVLSTYVEGKNCPGPFIFSMFECMHSPQLLLPKYKPPFSTVILEMTSLKPKRPLPQSRAFEYFTRAPSVVARAF